MKLILIASLTLGVTAWAAAQQDPVGHPAGYQSFEPCAKCHLKAGAAKDFVYIGRFAPAK
ncbi:MAG: hypothetical protein K2Y23_16995 [Cyanobacteria bacterium]|nr:hypothetical protein [Cyanobacteriota bacterium]